MFLFIKFVHIIVAMIYFAMPFTFGRWYHTVNLSKSAESKRYAMVRMRLFCLLYLNLSAVVLMGTGIWMSAVLGYWGNNYFPKISLALMLATLININAFLVPLLSRERAAATDSLQGPEAAAATRVRLAIFSATHHTLVTIMAALMVWKP